MTADIYRPDLWQNYFLMLGGGAAALTGLVFVALSLNLEVISHDPTKARPAVRDLPADIDGYDIVFLGYPNWWGTAPMPVFTFLEAYDFSGKTIVPFCTHGGGGLGRSERDIAAATPGATVLEGLAIRGDHVRDAEQAVRRWVEASEPTLQP